MEERGRGNGYASGDPKSKNKAEEIRDVVDISDEAFWESGRTSKDKASSNRSRGGGISGGTQSDARTDSESELTTGIAAFPAEGELTITSVTALKRPKHRYQISFGSYTLEVHEDVLIKYRMMKGAVFTRAELEEIVLADERQRAYGDALLALSRKMRTSYEITMRLGEKGWGPDVVNEVIKRLTEERLIDDAVYAQEWAHQRVRSRGKGKMWVRHELRQKGVEKPLIEEALGMVSEEEEMSSARELAFKKWRSVTGEMQDRKRKTGAFLMRRGYSGSLVSKVLRSIIEEEGMSGGDEEEWES